MSEPRDQRERETGRTPGEGASIRPWDTEEREAGIWIVGTLGEHIALVILPKRAISQANARLIVQAVNERASLLEALRAVKAERLYGHLAGWPQEQTEKAWALVEAALSRAKGEEGERG